MFRAVNQYGFGQGWRRDSLDPLQLDRRRTFSLEQLRQAAAVRKFSLYDTPQGHGFTHYDQGQIGACQFHAGARLAQTIRRKLGLTPDFVPSRLAGYYAVRKIEQSVGSDAGGTMRDVMKVLVNVGVFPETEWPYDGYTTADPVTGLFPPGCRAVTQPPPALYAEAKLHETVRDGRVDQDEMHIKAALLSGYPVMFGFEVLDSFFDAAGRPVTDVPMPKPGDSQEGGHGVVLWGWNDDRPMPGGLAGAFQVANSWGDQVQDHGDFWMPKPFLCSAELCSDFWTVTQVAA